MIAIVVLTYNRMDTLRKCVERVLGRTSDKTTEIVIWNNGSLDETSTYLSSLQDRRIRFVNHDRNLGQNAYAQAFASTSAPFMIELDDDIVDAPEGWDATLLEAFLRLPDVGFLTPDLEDDPYDEAAHVRHRIRPHEYVSVEVHGVRLLYGPAGGGCAMTSRELYDRVGGFRQSRQVFWLEDEAYIADLQKLGYRAAILADLKVLHQGGPQYTTVTPEKAAYWARYRRRRARRDTVKRLLMRIPLMRSLNERHAWFQPPEQRSA